MVICIVGGIAVYAACVMHKKWTNKMRDCVEEYKKVGGDPEGLTFGTKPYWPAKWARWSTLAIPLVFFGAWLSILLGASWAHGKSGQETKTMQETAKQSLEHAALAVYVASPLGFAESTKSFMNDKLIPAIQGTGVRPINPWDPNPKMQGKIEQTKEIQYLGARKVAWIKIVEELGRANADKIEKADGIVAILDGVDVDSGTAAEVGYGTALGKWVIGYRGDSRRTGENEVSEVNLQVEYFIRRNGGVVVHSLTELTKELKQRTSSLRPHSQPDQISGILGDTSNNARNP
jgi:nucleoside 2-deoxyribosyltransferase